MDDAIYMNKNLINKLSREKKKENVSSYFILAKLFLELSIFYKDKRII